VATVSELRFRVMGSDGHVIVVGGPPGLVERARDRLRDLEARWSRFIPASEVSVLNHRAGMWTEVSTETVALLERAQVAQDRTDGLFDPTRLAEVVRAGYATSFDAPGFGDPRAEGTQDIDPVPVGSGRPAGVEVDRIGGRARVIRPGRDRQGVRGRPGGGRGDGRGRRRRVRERGR
jgi:hypothetical protein